MHRYHHFWLTSHNNTERNINNQTRTCCIWIILCAVLIPKKSRSDSGSQLFNSSSSSSSLVLSNRNSFNPHVLAQIHFFTRSLVQLIYDSSPALGTINSNIFALSPFVRSQLLSPRNWLAASVPTKCLYLVEWARAVIAQLLLLLWLIVSPVVLHFAFVLLSRRRRRRRL